MFGMNIKNEITFSAAGHLENFPSCFLVKCFVYCGVGAMSMYKIEIQSQFSQYWPSVMSFWSILSSQL